MRLAKPKIEDRRSKIAILDLLSSILGFYLLVSLLTLAHSASALEVPALKGRVNDYAGMLPAARARDLEERLKRFEEQTGHQIAVLTIPSLKGDSLEGFSIKVAESWKIGKKGFDNGAILLIVRDDRALRIEVGYGLEGVLPDAIASRVIREVILPRFRANDYPGGIEAGLDAIMKVTRGEALPEAARKQRPDQTSGANWLFLLFLASIVIVPFLSQLTNRRSRNSWIGTGRRRSGYRGGPFYGGGGFGGGFGGGGGFSGGGGGFGGGGASGRW
ncbi:MAG: TPM domain-containing protein [Candidatus Binatia bacterium]